MSKLQFLRMLEQTLRISPETLTGDEKLSQVPNWDSMSTLAFIVMADRKLGVALKGHRVLACQTVSELFHLVGTSRVLAA